MGTDQTAQLVQTALVMILVVSALLSRRLAWRQVLRMALAWLAIFALLLFAVAQRDQLVSAVHGLSARMGLAEQQASADGREVVLRRATDGHFWAEARINDRPLRMMIDSGASITAISEQARLQLGLTSQSGFGAFVETANGPVKVDRLRLRELAVEQIVARDLAAVTSPNFGNTNVLGMNFLDGLQSWTVSGDRMTLRP
jgi:aspartyl protease family protein